MLINKSECTNRIFSGTRLLSRLLAAVHVFNFHLIKNRRSVHSLFHLIINLKNGAFGYVYKNHLLLHVPDGGWKGIFKEVFEQESYSLILGKKDPLIIDVGAHLGFSVIYFKKKYPSSKVLAYEPNPVLFKSLKENVYHNLKPTVGLFNVCISSSESKKKNFYFKTSNMVGGSIVDKKQKKWDEPWLGTGGGEKVNRILVHNISLRELVRAHKSIDLLKIDAEGAEYELIPEIIKYKKQIKSLIVEVHPFVAGKNNSGLGIVSRLAKHYNLHIESNPFYDKSFINKTAHRCNPIVVYGKLISNNP